MADSFKNVDEIILERASEGIGSVKLKLLTIKKKMKVMVTHECYDASVSSLLLYKTKRFYFACSVYMDHR